MIDFNAIKNAELLVKPFKVGITTNLFTDPKPLFKSYPNSGFHNIEKGTEHEKQYRFSVREITTSDLENDFKNLGKCWQILYQEVSSVQYRDAILKAIDLDISGLKFKMGFYKYYRTGDWISPHKDKPEKILNHVMFFNETWNCANGGQFLGLRSQNMDDIVFEVEPLVGNSVFFEPRENSWHAVRPLLCDQPRLSVQIEIFRTQF
ncbi:MULTISPECIES: 2OG-Fe(II) oxygenase family protein [Photorhabdus]|uniref:Prolyl 4-hydroxylase alpha subunit domain-containing protein n=2 Tax=Photorhabdus asymbiotica TaxID=291112 RepID=C7BKM7_PHOAA|nr:2OG-Fe(II) oxygenase [Photorhabdus asymbiotica]RKS57957.1 2-oxoglutarate-Fe(II)-dependent oxygenase superfamily protein [Photorhabdus asymbiotica]CAQ82713.1 conserved hypothetical protein [Photorhabdus asymbiotica]